jgi:serine/threonine protein kinase
MQQLVGQVLSARYQTVAVLGEGGMGAVYRAQDLTLKREVAVKVMSPHLAGQPDFKKRFVQEAQTTANLNHPGVVQVHDFGQHNQLLYIVMEFIPGDNLRQMLRKLQEAQQWIPLSEACLLVRMTSLTLDYIHHQKVLHRDIKPANLMLKPEASDGLPYRPVLTDLGLAKLVEGGLSTQTGTSMGTPAYMSPEQALGQETDARSDVYSLGILLYELAVGRLPFQVQTITEAIRYHTTEPPPPPTSLRAELPEALEQVILKTLAKAPKQRYADAKALAEALTEPGLIRQSETTVGAVGSEISLLTRFQESLIGDRGVSIMRDFSRVPVDLSGDAVQVMTPDGTIQTVPMLPQGLSIGRKADNDLVLDDPKVSGQHARIEFDGLHYQVVDLNSTNGTFLANTQLLSGVPEVWPPDKALRVGPYWLRLRCSQKGQSGSRLTGGSTMVDPASVRSGTAAGRVGAFLAESQFRVEPGRATIIPLVIINRGEAAGHFQVAVEGIPQAWLQLPGTAPELLPGGQQELRITVKPPQVPQSRADDYPLVIRVNDHAAFDHAAEANAILTVTPFYQTESKVRPQRLKAGQQARVVVENRGNTKQTYTVKWQDKANELVFEPAHARLTVKEGEAAAAGFEASPSHSRWLGGAKTHQVTIRITAPNEKERRLNSEVVSRGVIPVWVPLLLLLLCLVLSAGAAFGYNIYLEGQRHAAATAQAAASGTAQAVATVTGEAILAVAAQVETATAEFVAGANRTTVEAATATAIWLDEDDDRDRLSNRQELEVGTRPDNPDTDQDGLDDGDELETWDTDPLAPDTDSDGITDGDEVSRGINPTNADTDGDGIPDIDDLAPLQTSTPTPDASATAQVMADQTAAAQQTANALAASQTAAAEATAQQAANDATATAVAAAVQSATAAAATAQVATANAATAQAATATRIAQDAAAATATRLAIENPLVEVWTDQTPINEGTCTNINWKIEGVAAIYLSGGGFSNLGISGNGQEEVCPPATTTFTWRIIRQDGVEMEQPLTVVVIPKPPTTPALPPPVTHSTGSLDIPQTWTADLDEGVVGAGANADIWFEADTAVDRFVTPKNGAGIAMVGPTSVGRDGCAAAPLASTRIDINNLPEGTYLCVRTNLGRYSQFRVNAPVNPSPGTLTIGYTTWE